MTKADPAREAATMRALEIGGRLAEPPSTRLQATAFAEEVAGQRKLLVELGLVDLAHTVTMAAQGVIPDASARRLVAALLELQEEAATFQADPRRGDVYTNREACLAERSDAVGWLGVSRARREALTTAYHLLLRGRLLDLGDSLVGLGQSIVQVASAHLESLMPDYTYLQAAQPTTFGHYVSGFAGPLLRDLERLAALYARVDLSPAGCGSSNGSVIFQNRGELARRLGFTAPVQHARDAMWQADLAIEALGLAVAIVVGLDRLAEDLMIFATAEFGFLRLSDRHARASKIMPQKRNPFALAYVRATANRLIGVQAGIAAAGRTPSGQMDNRLQAYEAVPAALCAAAESADLMAEVLAGLSFDKARAEQALADRSVCATDLAERLTLGLSLDYRSAHRLVGELIRHLEEGGRTLASVTAAEVAAACAEICPQIKGVPEGLLEAALDPWSCVQARRDVGGCAREEVKRVAAAFADRFSAHRRWLDDTRSRVATANERLLAEARDLAGVGA